MTLRFLLFSGTLWVSSVALGQHTPSPERTHTPPREFNQAFRASDRDKVFKVSEGREDPTEVCVVAMLRVQALREVHVPRGIRFTDFDRALLDSARTALLQLIPATVESFERCLTALNSEEGSLGDRETLTSRLEGFLGDRASLSNRLADLHELARALDRSQRFQRYVDIFVTRSSTSPGPRFGLATPHRKW